MFQLHSTALLNPQTPKIFCPFPLFPSSSSSSTHNFHSSQTLKFPRIPHSFSPSLHSFNPQHYDLNGEEEEEEEEEEHVIGDCLVYEEGIFEEPISLNGTVRHNNPTSTPPKRSFRKKVPEIPTENLVPEKWREIQAEINITKRERRKIAQEMEFNSRVLKKKQGLVPLREMDLDEYRAYREAKLAHLNPLLLDSPSSFPVKEKEGSVGGERGELSDDDENYGGDERVKPKNPRWAVYGKGFDDVNEFFNSVNYDPTAKNTEGAPRRRLFTKEEKVLLNKRIPDLAAATSDKWLPLHTLAACGEFYLVDSLLKHNVDINAVDKDGLTALHKAIIGKKQAITNYLLRNSANPFILDKEGATLMHYAVQTASSQAIKILLLYNVDINLQDNDGWTPLHLAVQAQRTDLVRLLLIKGADKRIKNKDGLTALDLCLYFGQCVRTYELIKLLKQPQKRVICLTKSRSFA